MLRIAQEDGICGIVATPHLMNGVYDNTKETIGKAIEELRNITNGYPIYIGAEVRISRDLADRIDNNELPLINNKNYLLLELPAYVIPPISELENIIKGLKMKGITPIISHPERNMAILNDLSIMGRLIKCGVLFQVTAMSIVNQFGRNIQKATLKMIKNGYVHVVASDAHDAEKRPPKLSDAYVMISKKFGKYVALRLFADNPLKIINGEKID